MSLEGASLSLTGDFSRPSKKEGSLSFVSDIGRPPTTRAFCMMPLYLNFTGVRLSSLQTSHGVNAPLHSGNSGPLSSALRMSSARCKLSTARRATPFSCTVPVAGARSSFNESAGVSGRSVLQCAPLLRADRKGSLNVVPLHQRVVSSRRVRCHVAGGNTSQGAGFDAEASAPSATEVTLAQKVRAFFFYLTTFVVAAPLFVVMLILQPFVLVFDKHRRKAQHLVNKVWATLTTFFFYKTEIYGWENLPGPDEGAVYVANHQSFLDIYTLFQLGRPFKFISKTSNFFIPIIGWSMYLTGHVPLKRMDKKSQMECLKKCVQLVKQGVPVLFFPEGTRTADGKLASFKKGAFTVAAKGGVPVVPISLIGTGKLMPNGLEGTLRPGGVKIFIHPTLRSSSADQLCDESRAVIAKTLVEHGLPVHP